MTRAERRRLASKDKIRLLKKHFVDKKTISEICEAEGVVPGSFYLWQRELFDKGDVVFDLTKRGRKPIDTSERTIAALRAKLAEKNEVIAELMQETLKLKKPNGEI
jgi:transposase